ncbi:sce7725 family protein [Psychrobacter aquimaris]|uniref:sce7725 family protein n=1 Tax=Psychrobacter aquimaris TaxID=292733 RepID=UPI003FD1A01D
MYFPFLRNKQNEILAIKELGSDILKSSVTISPIFEPVKLTGSFKKNLPSIAENNINFTVIINPREGEFLGRHEEIIKNCTEILGSYNNYQFGVIIDENTNIQLICDILESLEINKKLTLIHYKDIEDVGSELACLSEKFDIVTNVINVNNIRDRYFSNFEESSIVTLRDCFISQEKNADYLGFSDSRFSNDHETYLEDNLKGFSDYLTIGDNYTTGGFAPYAVAIHITYLDNKGLRIKHFTSDSNFDTKNTSGKFLEALEKLVNCDEVKNLDTIAMREFLSLYERKHFPGLGVVKKLSVMHHIEIVDRVLKK